MINLGQLQICFLAGTLGQGGAERQLFYTLQALRQSGASLHLLSLTRGEFWEERIRELGIPITWVGQSESRIARLIRILNALRRGSAAIVQSQHFHTNLYAAMAARFLRLREVGAIRSDGISEIRMMGPLLGALCLRAPRVIAANSQNGINNAMQMGLSASRCHFLPNIIDTDEFRCTKRTDNGVVRVLAVGRMISVKRFDRFLRILVNLRRKSHRTVKGVLVGDGPLRGDLERQAREFGLLPDALEFTGAVDNPARVYQDADILVFTSDWEGTPNVLLEAMASGLPVVATRVGGVSEIVTHNVTGLLIEPSDEGAMTKALLELIHNPSVRMNLALEGRAYIEANHALRRLPGMLTALYERVLA